MAGQGGLRPAGPQLPARGLRRVLPLDRGGQGPRRAPAGVDASGLRGGPRRDAPAAVYARQRAAR
eukprot:7024428-Lingulodinium_polyedra.AAC.1